MLINEKEKLLRELRSLLSQNKGTKLKELKIKCSRLEQDLNEAQEMTNRCIAGKRKTIIIAEQKSNAIKMIFFFLLPDRLRIHETKQMLLQQLTEAMRSMTQLESQLKVLSASTLSMSSSSSLGSLSSSHASSKGNGIF